MYRPCVSTYDLHSVAVRVASSSVTAAKRGKKSRGKKRAAPRRDIADSLDTVAEDVLASGPEYACRIELDISAAFEGTANKSALIRKIKASLLSAVKSSMTDVARSMNLRSGGVKVRPLRLECDLMDV